MVKEETRLLLDVADEYFDAAPRTDAAAETVGAFTLFRSNSVWSYYARPRRGLKKPVSARDIAALAERCQELALDLSLEWIGELTPSLHGIAEQAGLDIEEHALLALAPGDLQPVAPVAGVRVEHLAANDAHLVTARAVAEVAFSVGGTRVGAAGPRDREERATHVSDDMRGHLARRAAAGLTVTAVAVGDDDGVLATGSLQPVHGTGEVLAVATLPCARRRGLAGAITTSLVQHAERRGVTLLLLSAENDDVARVYQRVGFRRVGTHHSARANGLP